MSTDAVSLILKQNAIDLEGIEGVKRVYTSRSWPTDERLLPCIISYAASDEDVQDQTHRI